MSWKDLLEKAYVPYSKIPNACIIQGHKGDYFSGVRIENVSFPLTITALQAACCICLAYGQRPKTIFLKDDNNPQFLFWKQEFNCEVVIGEIPDKVHLYSYREQHSKDELTYLKQLLNNAVTPNSEFPVSAILKSDTISISGVNVEVSDWTKGLCAERVAICKAIAEGITNFKTMSVHTLKGEFSSPCGACRQVLFEHLPLSKTELYHANGTYSEHFNVDLLPFSFTSRDLHK